MPGKLVGANLTVVEDVPLPTDFQDATVCVATGGCCGPDSAVGLLLTASGIDDGATVHERTQRLVAVGIGQGVVGVFQTKFARFRPTAVHKHILILDFSHGRRLEKAEVTLLLTAGNHILYRLGTGKQTGHGRRIHFSSIGGLKTPVSIHLAIIVHKHGGVKAQHADSLPRIRWMPVAYLKRAIGAVRCGHHGFSTFPLIVGIQVIDFFTISPCHHRHIGCIEQIAFTVWIQRFTLGIQPRLEDDPIVPPLTQIFHRCRPHHLIQTAILPFQHIVRAVQVHPELSGVIGIFKHIGLPIGNVFPQRQDGVVGLGFGRHGHKK